MNLSDSLEAVKQPESNHYDTCYSFALTYLSRAKGKFTSEDVRDAYYYAGHPQPKETRVWGAVFKKMQTEGRIVSCGYVKYRGTAGHSRPSTLWRKSEPINLPNQLNLF